MYKLYLHVIFFVMKTSNLHSLEHLHIKKVHCENLKGTVDWNVSNGKHCFQSSQTAQTGFVMLILMKLNFAELKGIEVLPE